MSDRKKTDNSKGGAVQKEKGNKQKGRQKNQAGSARASGGAGQVDIRAIKRMLGWQLELLDRLRVVTLSTLEVVEGRAEKSRTP